MNGCLGGKMKSATTASIRILQDKVKENLFVCLSEHKAIITYGKVEVFLHAFLSSSLRRDLEYEKNKKKKTYIRGSKIRDRGPNLCRKGLPMGN
jgi:hypothetical protein